MRSARLHGIRDMRVERIPVPAIGDGDLLVAIEACGVCATNSRKYDIGVNDGDYPFNPGHEWLGRVAAVGSGVTGWKEGDRVYGDVFGGYADFCVIPAQADRVVARTVAAAGGPADRTGDLRRTAGRLPACGA